MPKKKKEYPTKEEFINSFKQELNKQPMSSYKQRENYLVRGENALNEYYVQLCNTPVKNLYATEKKVLLEIDGIKFKGIIDRIDKNDDGTYTIYDYKTGSAKNEKVICLDGEHEDYYNQIGLYKYYFEKDLDAKVKDTVFIFPEEFTKNFTLNLTDEDCNSIVSKFKNAISDIKSYKFEPSNNDDVCKLCQFKYFCNL